MGLFSFFGSKEKKEYVVSISKKIPVGDAVKVWLKPNSNIINIYEFGTTSGDGLIAQFNNKYIARHIQNGKAIESVVVNNRKVLIRLLDFSPEELHQIEYIENDYDKLLIELKKKTRIKKVEFRVTINKTVVINVGDTIFPVFNDSIEDHIDIWNKELKFIDTNGSIVGEKSNEPSKIKQILRLHFANGLETIMCKVESVHDMGNWKDVVVLADVV